MKLAEALRLMPSYLKDSSDKDEARVKPPCLALVGAGGKTSAMFTLGRELLAAHSTALLSTSTHLALDQAAAADWHWIVTGPADLSAELPPGVGLLTGPARPDGRWGRLAVNTLAALHALATAHSYPLLVESDGSRRLPLKAPAEHEPAIPSFVDQVLVVAGLSGLGQPLDSEHVHRPEYFAACSGLELGQPVTAEALKTVLQHPQGGLRGIPPGARRVALLNQADSAALQALAQSMAQPLLASYDAVVISSLLLSPESKKNRTEAEPGPALAAYEPVAGIVLAAGGAQRMGRSKQLLELEGEPLVRRAARTALAAGLAPVVVVVGAEAEAVSAALEGLMVQIAPNPAWAAGQSTSLHAGLAALPQSCGATIFLLADQPFAPRELLSSLRELHAQSLPALAAPMCGGRRANPALFDRRTFSALRLIQGDSGGRVLFGQSSRFPVAWLPWLDERLLMDVDTPEDYRRLLGVDS